MNKLIIQIRSFSSYFKIALVAAPVVIFVVSTVVLAIDAASFGAKLHSLEEKEAELEIENKDLSDMMISGTSVGELSVKSEELGFSKPEKIVYITEDRVVANAH